MSVPLVELKDLEVTYATAGGEVPAVRGVDLKVGVGEKVGLAGESGCGKSTLALALLRLLPKTTNVTGQVLLAGEDIVDMKWGRLRAVRWAGASIIFQGAMHSLNAVQKTGTQIAEPILLHEEVDEADAERRVRHLLEQVGLSARLESSYPYELSGGQRQRVMIAMALACNPQLIIADEPTTALDVMIQAQILRLIDELVTDHGISLLMISHDLSVLADTCDRLAIMYAGRVVEVGPSDEVYNDARHPYSAALAGAFPRIGDDGSRRNPQGLAGDPPDPSDLPPGCVFAPRCPSRLDLCSQVDPSLWPAGDDSEAACVLVLPDQGESLVSVGSSG